MSPRALYARFLVLCACAGLGTLFVSLSARASAPPPPGFRTLRPWTPPPPSAAPRRSSLSLLDEAGRMLRPVPPARLAAWRRSAGRLKSSQQLHEVGLRRLSEAALAHVHLGEWELVRAQQPAAALGHFRQARRLARRSEPVYGLAAYDEGVTLFREGSYRQARDEFAGVLKAKPALKGFDRRTCSLFLRHASACYGYHQERERAGITEPKRLDPECAAAGLAVCLRGLQIPNSKLSRRGSGTPSEQTPKTEVRRLAWDRKSVLATIRRTGFGSSLQDLLDAGTRLGLSARAVTADEAGLRALPKPVVAFVEHDHFIAVTRADQRGVTYLCSDCGCWPGGERRLSWEQWKLMEAGPYCSIVRAGSVEDRALAVVVGHQQPRTRTTTTRATTSGSESASESESLLRLAAADVRGLALRELARVSALTALLKGHVLAAKGSKASTFCGGKLTGQHCVPGEPCCPMAGPGGPHWGLAGGGGLHAFGPGAGDPVNLATLEEEYTPAPDLVVYNPHGPAVVWSRIYNSMRPPNYTGIAELANDDHFGVGWSHSYNVGVFDPYVTPVGCIPRGSSGHSPLTGTDGPSGGVTWDIIQGGGTVATSSSPGSWSVSVGAGTILAINVPSGATIANDYELRYAFGGMFGNKSQVFDVVAAGSLQQGGSQTLSYTGTHACAGGLSWDIQRDGSTVATSSDPKGWTVGATLSNAAIGPPLTAAISSNYELRVGTGFFAHSVTFAVIGGRYKTASGTKYLVMENGAMIPLSAASVPDSMTTDVACSVDAGAPLLADWIYDGGRCGYYVITWPDGSRWTLRAALPVSSGTSLYYELVKLEDRVGNALTFSYGAYSNSTYGGFPLLLSINDGSTGTALLTLTHAGGGNGNLTAVSDCYNRSVYYHIGSYGTSNVPGPYIQSYQELDEVSQIVTTGTGSPPLRYAYDYASVGNGEPNDETVPFLHTIEVPSPTGTGSSTATINYEDDTCYVTSIVDGNGNQVVFDDVDASHTQVFYKDPMGNTVYSYTVGFDASMNETSRTDGTNSTVVVSKVYGDANDPFRASSVTDGNGNEWEYTWDSFGHMLTETSPRGTTTSETWDYGDFPLGRLTSVQEGTKTATTISYFEPSGLIDTIDAPRPGTSGGTTVAMSFTFSGIGNVTGVTAPGNNATTTRTTSYGYQTDGMYSQSEARGQILTGTNELSKATHFRYDSRGNTTVQADAYGNETDFSYNIADQLTQISYPATGQTGAGHAHLDYAYLYAGGPLLTKKLYNENNTQVREIDHTYGEEGEHLSTTGSTEPVSYASDAAYRISALSDGNSHSTHYYYNTAGYLSEVRYPGYTSGNADRVQYLSYDDDGNLLERIDGRGIETDYEYTDDESKLTDIEYPASSGLNVHFTYDAYGRRDSMTDGTGSHAYEYDDLNTLTSDETTYTGLAAKTISYAFYADGSRETMSTPAGDFSYEYDAVGRVTGLTNPNSEGTAWSYLDNGWLHDQTLNNGAVTTYTHNELGEITDLVTTVGMTTRTSFTDMAYDAAMNRTTLTASIPAHTAYDGETDWSYDTKNQLTQEASARAGGYTENFGFDSAGNPTTWKGASRSFNSNNQDTGNTFDGDGNPTTYQSVGMTFDPEDRLTQVGSGTLTAGYTSAGLRAWKTAATTTTYFLYDGQTPVVELNGAGSVAAVNTYGADGLLSRRAGSTTVYYTFDPEGSIVQRLDGSAGVLTSQIFDGFGVGGSTASYAEPFGFCAQWGYYTDQETGLVLCTHRYYDPNGGRWLTRDPIGSAGGMNLYSYTGNGAVGRADPSGLLDPPGDMPPPEPPLIPDPSPKPEPGPGENPLHLDLNPGPPPSIIRGPLLNPELPPGVGNGKPSEPDCTGTSIA